jgi:hypothetical protein
VHDDGIRERLCHDHRVQLIGLKNEGARVFLGLLAHRGPHIGVNGIGTSHSLPCLVHHKRLPAGNGTDLVGVAHHLLKGLEAGRSGNVDSHARRGPGEQQGMGDVVAVADVGQGAAFEIALQLPQGLQIGGTLEFAASSSSRSWPKVRMTTAST